jgi:glutaredoxin 3
MHLYRRTEPTLGGLGEILLTATIEPDASVDVQGRSCLFPAATVELKLYSREWCSWCIDAKDYLAEKGYRFLEIDVGKDRKAYEEMKQLSAQTYVPTFVAGDKVLANFDTCQLEKFLNEHQISP